MLSFLLQFSPALLWHLQWQGYVVLGVWCPESGYELCQCLASTETKIISWKDWGPSVVCPSCLSLHVVASVTPNSLPTSLENTSQIVQILWTPFSPPVQHLLPCVLIYRTKMVLFFSFKWNGWNYRSRTTITNGAEQRQLHMSFMFMQNMGKHFGAVNDPTWSNQVVRQYLVISCNHKICQGKVFLLLR